MKYKTISILKAGIQKSTAANALGHMALSLGYFLGEDYMGKKEIIDASGLKHRGISKYPYIVLKADEQEIKKISESVRINENIVLCEFFKDHLETYEDSELVKSIESKKTEEFEYLGITLHGLTEEIDKYTKHLKLW